MPSRCGHRITYPTCRSVRAGLTLRRSHRLLPLLVERQRAAIPPGFPGFPGQKIKMVGALDIVCEEVTRVSAPYACGNRGPDRCGTPGLSAEFLAMLITAAARPLDPFKPLQDRPLPTRLRCGGRRCLTRHRAARGTGRAGNRARRRRPVRPRHGLRRLDRDARKRAAAGRIRCRHCRGVQAERQHCKR